VFGGNPFGWSYFGQAYPGGSGGGSGTPEDNDTATLLDKGTVTTAVSASDSASLAEGVPKIGIRGRKPGDTILDGQTDSAALTETASAVAQGPNVFDSDTFTTADTASALAVAVAASDSFSLTEAPPAITIPSQAAIQDTDTIRLTESGSNASGGVADAIKGVCISFSANAFDASPVWTRLDQPAGVR